MNATATHNTRLAELIAQALPEGYTAEIIGTGGNCQAIEVKWDTTEACVLVTDGDARLPFDDETGDVMLMVGGYDAEGELLWDDGALVDLLRNLAGDETDFTPELVAEIVVDAIRDNMAV